MNKALEGVLNIYSQRVITTCRSNIELCSFPNTRLSIIKDRNNYWRPKNFSQKSYKEFLGFLNKSSYSKKIERPFTPSAYPYKNDTKIFAYHLLTAVSYSIEVSKLVDKNKLNYKPKQTEIEKVKAFLKKAKEFNENFYGNKASSNPIIEMSSNIIMEFENSNSINEFIKFPETISKIEIAVKKYEKELLEEKSLYGKKKKSGNSFHYKDKLIALAIITVCKQYCPNIVMKVTKEKEKSKLELLFRFIFKNILDGNDFQNEARSFFGKIINDAIDTHEQLIGKKTS